MIQQIQTFLNIPAYTGPSGKNGMENNYFSKNIRLKPLLKQDLVTFSGNKNFVRVGFPDLKQHAILGWEEYYCAPVSAANGILSLRKKTYKDENILIRTLAAHFNTDTNGTTSNNLCKGLSTFFNKKEKFKNLTLEYQGVRPVEDYKTANIPDLDKIKTEIEKPGFVLLNLGVYKKIGSGKTITYKREYGHWVNAIGYKDKSPNNNLLIINDPYKKSSGSVNLETNQVSNGTLIHNKDDNEKILTNQANGLYEITGIPYLEKNQVTLLEGAVFVKNK